MREGTEEVLVSLLALGKRAGPAAVTSDTLPYGSVGSVVILYSEDYYYILCIILAGIRTNQFLSEVWLVLSDSSLLLLSNRIQHRLDAIHITNARPSSRPVNHDRPLHRLHILLHKLSQNLTAPSCACIATCGV